MSERPGVAAILAELRGELKRQGIRIGTLARQLEVAEPTVWRWLRGEGLSLARLDQICAQAGLEMRDLVGRSRGPEQAMFTLAQERALAADRVLALAFFVVQIGLSSAWLARFKFGPVEWLWRCATYRRWMPLRWNAMTG